MKKVYDSETLKQINENVNLLEYVSNSLELKKKGEDYWGHCPLHIDKTPSFSITPSKNAYYCFSCGKSGHIISYLINYEKLKYDEAVEKAAKLANFDLSKICKSETVAFLKEVHMAQNRHISVYQHEILDCCKLEKFQDKVASEWLQEGIKPEIMKLFGVRIDSWSNRIVYPVYDIDNNLINVKGRTRYENFKELGLAKYINYYPVGVMDYFQGLNITLPYIKQANEIIIFESLKSVMKLFGWNYKNSVSAEKHTLTDEQINLLIKLRVNIVFAYDFDVVYEKSDVKSSIDKLKRITNVYVIKSDIKSKDSPADRGVEFWEQMYAQKQKIT